MLWWDLWGRNVTLGRSQSQVQFDSSKYKGDSNLARMESREFVTKLALCIRFCWSESEMANSCSSGSTGSESRARLEAAGIAGCSTAGLSARGHRAASMLCWRSRLQAERCSWSFYCLLVLTVNNKGSWKSIFLAKMNLQWLGCF